MYSSEREQKKFEVNAFSHKLMHGKSEKRTTYKIHKLLQQLHKTTKMKYIYQKQRVKNKWKLNTKKNKQKRNEK